jgi:hypothetical protein
MMLAGTLLMMVAASAQADGSAQRKALVTCFRETVTQAQEQKRKPAEFETLARERCAAQITAFRSAVVAFDLRNGRARKAAESDVDLQVADYVVSFSERLDAGS